VQRVQLDTDAVTVKPWSGTDASWCVTICKRGAFQVVRRLAA
jgi:hypothetical protein